MKTALQTKPLTLTRPHCSQCVKLQEEIKRLREKIHGLESQLRYQQRQITEGYFGSSTPSSQKPFKANTKAERHNGGGRHGHPWPAAGQARIKSSKIRITAFFIGVFRSDVDSSQFLCGSGRHNMNTQVQNAVKSVCS